VGRNLKEVTMKIAVPVLRGQFSSHFGGADRFALFDVDEGTKAIRNHVEATPPPHEQGSYPGWLAEQGVHTVLAGGMGPRAVGLLEGAGVRVVLGVQAVGDARALVEDYLRGALQTSGEMCHDHSHHGCEGH
jgi:predicted Fe-Mo cluster-binding NifX family protein